MTETPADRVQRSIRAIGSECNLILDDIAGEKVCATSVHELDALIGRIKVSLKALEQYTEDFDHGFAHLEKKSIAE
jgi:hypothetical protein